MPLCQSCTYPVNKYVVGCDACDSRAERAADRTRRANEDEARETQRFRDRCALNFAMMIHGGEENHSNDRAAELAYEMADALLAERARGTR